MQISDAKIGIPLPFYPGAKVRYISSYGETQTPKRWEIEPFRVLRVDLSFSWVDWGYTKKFYVQRWDATEAGKYEYSEPIFSAWEHQLELWREEDNNA